jgi:hypothetical protein
MEAAGHSWEGLGRRAVAGTMCGAGRSWEFDSVAALVEVWAVVLVAVNSAVELEEGWAVVVEVGMIRLAVEWAVVGVGDSIERVRSGLGEGKMEEEHNAAGL